MDFQIIFLSLLLTLGNDGTIIDAAQTLILDQEQPVVQEMTALDGNDGTIIDAAQTLILDQVQPVVQKMTTPEQPAAPDEVSLPTPAPVAKSDLQPHPTNIVISIESLNLWLYSILGGLILAGIVWIIIQWRRTPRIGMPNQAESKNLYSQVSQIATSKVKTQGKNAPDVCLPYGIFPSEWLNKVKPERLQDFITHAKTAATNAFFMELGDSKSLPTTDQLKMAQDKMAQELSARITTTGTFEMLNGDEGLGEEVVKYLQQQEVLLPAIRVPQPIIVPGDINSLILCGLVFAGTILGFIVGGFIGNWGIGLPPDAGLIFGGALFAPLTLAGCLYLANNPQMKKWVLGIVGGMAITDFATQYFKGMIPLPTWIKGNNTAFYKRILFYAAVIVIVLIVKRDKTYDREQYREMLEIFAEQWLRSALPIFAVLMFRYEDTVVITEKTDLTNNLFQITTNLRTQTGDTCETGIKMLVQEFVSAGYTFPPLKRTIIWEEWMKDRYDTFGYIEPGTEVTIVKDYIMQNDTVTKKGLVSE